MISPVKKYDAGWLYEGYHEGEYFVNPNIYKIQVYLKLFDIKYNVKDILTFLVLTNI